MRRLLLTCLVVTAIGFPCLAEHVTFDDLPQAAQRNFLSKFDKNKLHHIEKDRSGKTTIYKVFIERDSERVEVWFSHQGAILKSIEARDRSIEAELPFPKSGAETIALKDLPEPVRDTILSEAPEDKIESISRAPIGSQTVYQVLFHPGVAVRQMRIGDNGRELRKILVSAVETQTIDGALLEPAPDGKAKAGQ